MYYSAGCTPCGGPVMESTVQVQRGSPSADAKSPQSWCAERKSFCFDRFAATHGNSVERSDGPHLETIHCVDVYGTHGAISKAERSLDLLSN